MSPFLECFVTRKACDMLSLAVEYDALLKRLQLPVYDLSREVCSFPPPKNTF